ncbi:receptor activity-modifying protein 2 [Echeneis naucrates]|uniref:receptor activity-modifying protein 2 n=1 Tax=Echeneis naucrates TaxID=173247 RepID=UPI001113990F|nr:receptor activity-modifying protein 2-like [Echeneis naucrates]
MNQLKHLQHKLTQGFNKGKKKGENDSKMVMIICFLTLVFTWAGMAAKFIPPCDHHMFNSRVDKCLSEFNSSMELSGQQDRCPWPAVKTMYYNLTMCMEFLANVTRCHGSMVDKVFLDVHKTHFSLCGQVQDPPLTTLIMLIAPAIIVTLLLPLLCTCLNSFTIEMPCKL